MWPAFSILQVHGKGKSGLGLGLVMSLPALVELNFADDSNELTYFFERPCGEHIRLRIDG